MAYFIDTSALAKRYVAEVGSVWLTAQIEPAAGNVVVISEHALVELFSVFARRQREKNLTAADVAKRRAEFLLHMEQEYLVVPMYRSVLIRAGDLVDKYPLRSLDAMQLACAIQAQNLLAEPLTFVSADRNLLTIAAAEGFSTDDPNAHP